MVLKMTHVLCTSHFKAEWMPLTTGLLSFRNGERMFFPRHSFSSFITWLEISDTWPEVGNISFSLILLPVTWGCFLLLLWSVLFSSSSSLLLSLLLLLLSLLLLMLFWRGWDFDQLANSSWTEQGSLEKHCACHVIMWSHSTMMVMMMMTTTVVLVMTMKKLVLMMLAMKIVTSGSKQKCYDVIKKKKMMMMMAD